MLILDLSRLMENKGILNPTQFMMNAGFTRYTANRLIYNKVRATSYSNLEKLSLLLNCTIDDLFTWHPDTRSWTMLLRQKDADGGWSTFAEKHLKRAQ